MVGHGVVGVPTSGGGGGKGGIRDEGAAATTTPFPIAVTDLPPRPPTTMILPRSSSASPVLLIDDSNVGQDDGDRDGSSLLPPGTKPDISVTSTSSTGGRGRSSGGPLGTHHYRDHSPPLPTVTAVGAARRHSGCPTALAVPLAR